MSKKTELLFNKIMLEQFNAEWGEYQSSALDAEKMFVEHGVKLPFKIYYQYKLPDGLSPFGLMMRYGYMYRLQDYEKAARKIGVGDTRYSEQEIADLENYILQNKDNWRVQMKRYVDEIKRLNPELANVSIKPTKVQDAKKNFPQYADKLLNNLELDFIHGVAFGFSPEDIEYYLNRTKDQIDVDTQEALMGIWYGVGHVVAPQFRDILKQAVAQIELNKNNGRE